MLTKIDTRLTLNAMLAAVLKAHFTRDELINLLNNGISIASCMSNDGYDSVLRGEGQKTSLCLQSRWKYDDSDDLLLVAVRDMSSMYTPRTSLETANEDGVIESLFGSAGNALMGTITGALAKLGTIETKRSGFNQASAVQVVGTDITERVSETLIPDLTFANPPVRALFFDEMLNNKDFS